MASNANAPAGKQRKYLSALLAVAMAGGVGVGFFKSGSSQAENIRVATSIGERVHAESPEKAGRYLVVAAGCNDCHTPGWMQFGEAIPEDQWLIGVPVGWRGPWGTTYASNLRLFVQDFDEDLFVQTVRARNSRPPMPWPSLHGMSDSDLRSIYRYIRSLPVKGEKMPQYCPPGVEPSTPYLVMEPQMPAGSAAAPKTNS